MQIGLRKVTGYSTVITLDTVLLRRKRRALIVLQGSAAREASKAAQDYADALLAEAARLAAAAAAADKAAQDAVRVAKHMRAAQIAAELVAKTMAAPASCQQDSNSASGRLPLAPVAAAKAPVAPVAAAGAPAVPKQSIPNLQGPRASAMEAGPASSGGQGRQQGAASSTGGTVSLSALQHVQTGTQPSLAAVSGDSRHSSHASCSSTIATVAYMCTSTLMSRHVVLIMGVRDGCSSAISSRHGRLLADEWTYTYGTNKLEGPLTFTMMCCFLCAYK